MTLEEKELLLRDLCARLPYKPYVEISDGKDWYLGNLLAIEMEHDKLCGTITNSVAVFEFLPERVKLYLRPFSSMTEDEFQEYASVLNRRQPYLPTEAMDWLNKRHFDYHGLIPMGLALEAPKNMYNTKTE